MSIPYSTKVNEQSAVPVINELHTIGILGTATYASGLIRLVQVPQGPGPAVIIPGYVEILSGTPTGVQFLVNYTTGVITFDPSLNGNVVLVSSYQGLGSEIAAEDVNELQSPMSTIAQQSIVYNWPLAPTVSYSLAPNIVSNSNISPTAAISLTKLQSLSPSIVPVTNGSGVLTSSSVSATTLSYLDATSSIQTQLNNKQAVGNYITALTEDVTATGPGSVAATVVNVGGSSASAVNSATVAANAATDLNTPLVIVKRDASGGFSAGSITHKNQHASIFEDTGSNTVSLEAPTSIVSSYTLKLPTQQGGASTVLTNDGFGNLSWTAGGGSGSPGGANNSLQYNASGSFGGATGIFTDGAGSITFTSPNFGEIRFVDNVHSFIGADSTGNIVEILGLDEIDLFTQSAGVRIVDNGFNAQITTNPSGVPDRSAILDLSIMSASQYLGFLPPLTTTAQRDTIGTPAHGTVTVVNYAALAGATYTINATGITYPAQDSFINYSVIDYTMLSGATITINATGIGGGTYTFTEGIDWLATISNAETARNIVTAINTTGAWNAYFSAGYTTANHLVVNAVTPGAAGNSIIASTSDNTNLPIDQGTSPQNFVGGSDAGTGTTYTLTEGVDWTASVDNDTTALSLGNAINVLPVVNAGVSTNVITVFAAKVIGSNAITQATSDNTNLHISGTNFTGEIDPTPGLMVYNKDDNQWNGWNGTNWAIIG